MAQAAGLKYINIQSMRRGDKLIPFEFNGRLSGSTAMVSKIFNAPEMFVRERLLGETLTRIENSTGHLEKPLIMSDFGKIRALEF